MLNMQEIWPYYSQMRFSIYEFQNSAPNTQNTSPRGNGEPPRGNERPQANVAQVQNN